MSSKLIQGAWRLLKCQSVTETGQEIPDMMADADGLICYDASGMMSVQIITASLKQPLPEYNNYTSQPPFTDIPDSVARASFEGFFAYFGPYEFDEACCEVRHQVIGSSMPHYIGRTLTRQFRFTDDDHLVLSTDLMQKPGLDVPTSRSLYWQRVN